jgi:hypothetical protein
LVILVPGLTAVRACGLLLWGVLLAACSSRQRLAENSPQMQVTPRSWHASSLPPWAELPSAALC